MKEETRGDCLALAIFYDTCIPAFYVGTSRCSYVLVLILTHVIRKLFITNLQHLFQTVLMPMPLNNSMPISVERKCHDKSPNEG